MGANTNNPEFLRAEGSLDEPHFDEESTLLSARPVVPLHEVKAEERSGRRLVFASLLVGAVMIGVFAATLVYKQGTDSRSTEAVESSRPVSAPDQRQPGLQAVGGASSNSDFSEPARGAQESASSEAEQAQDHVRPQASRNDSASTVSNRSSPRIPGKPASSAGANQPDKQEIEARDDDKEREMRRAERREARRLKRMEERDARHQASRDTRAPKGRSDDDLLRIREIFEGSPRP